MSVRPSGTVTFLFTDLEGSTRLWDDHPDAMRAALARHDAILRSAIAAGGGFVFSTGGDGLAAAFQRSVDALETAITAQRSLYAEAWPEPVVLRVRMGIHTGEAQERDRNYFGPPLNIAARLMAAAQGGQIIVSSATAEVMGPVAGIELVDLGSRRLKGLGRSAHAYGVRADGLAPLDLPLALAEGRTGNLPHPVTDFVGRTAELEKVKADLGKHRLVTLTGPGDVGKTRLAIEIAWSMVDDFVGGSWFADLASVTDPEAVVSALASLLSIQPQPGMTMVESITDWLHNRRLLLIVDNCEHVLAPVVQVVGAVLARSPTVIVLATSHEPLVLPGERVLRGGIGSMSGGGVGAAS